MFKTKPVLVVDLDNTLLQTDTLFEMILSAISINFFSVFKIILKFLKFDEISIIKEYLYNSSNINVHTLPYNAKVIEYISNFRLKGGYTVLATATNENLAKKIADHLNLFDEVFGSNSQTNLKGKIKADFLKNHFKNKSFDYIGDSIEDLEVWKVSSKAVAVNASLKLKNKIKKVNNSYEFISGDSLSFLDFLKVLRVHHWLKNFLVFLPMLASHQFYLNIFIKIFISFFSFSLVASSIYIINDLFDLDSDRNHPRKKNRIIASGKINIKYTIYLMIIFFILGITIAYFVNTYFLMNLLLYFSLSFTYSLYLKKCFIIDIIILSILYNLRIIGGGLSSNIDLSYWLLLFSFFIFICLASIKRLAELSYFKKKQLLFVYGRGYKISNLYLVKIISILTSISSITVLGFYINSNAVINLYSYPIYLSFLGLIIFYWLLRMIYLASKARIIDDPIVYAINDKQSMLCFIISTIILILAI